MKKKILAALMAAVMLFTILPLGTLDTAWAEERASATANSGSISSGELLDGYLYRLAGMDIRSYETGFSSSSMAASYSAKANLNRVEQNVYNTLKAEIEKIASGQRKDTNIKTTGVLGSQASADKVWHALMADLPYELYWHDKVIGINYAYTLTAGGTPFKDVTFSFAVAQEFRGADVTTTNIPNVPAAVQTARSVVAANASKSDYDKLQAYRQYICDQVSYNYAAARGEYTASYGSPWQLLWVFDGDASTNVVCEGYAKSFKYLCDLTEESSGWTGDVETISVTGTMGTENHMWNIVRIGGGNYLVDVTNCDTGMKGYPRKLFLRGAVGDGISYTVENTVYTYDDVTRTGFAAADLKLSGTDYTPAVTTLTAPTVTLKADASTGQPAISWSKVSGAAQYEVYRSATGKANSFSIIRRTAALSYTDTSAAAGNTYYYVVRAMKGSGSSATYSKFSKAQQITYTVSSLAVPAMTLTSAASGQPVISWSKVNGAAQYEIYRSVDGVKFSIIRRTAALAYTDTSAAAGTTYYYKVRAMSGSMYSDFCAVQTIKYAITSLTAPTMTLTSGDSGQPVISWTKVSGAAQYEIFRSTDGSKFSIIRRTAALSYTDTSAAAGTTYYYQVRAINGDVKSAFCAAQSIQYAIGSLTAPTMTLTSAAGGQPVISWSKVNGAAQYEIFRSTNGKNFSIIRRTAALSFTDTSAAAGTTYYYQVRAINGSVKSDFCPAQSISLTVSEYGGECGSRATWSLTDDGVLTISGKDGIYEYGWYEEDDAYHPAPWAEEGMPAVKKLVVNSGITYIGDSAFEGLDQLTSVSLPDTLGYIGWSAFRECASLTSIVIPEGIDGLCANTFARCTSLRSVKLPSTMRWIDGCIFQDCTSLQDIVLPEGLTDITWQMFKDCTSLRSITIPGSVMAIYDDAFSGCTALTSVIFGGSRADWESITFNTGNDALRRVTPTCTGSTGLAAPVVTGSTNRSGMPLIQWNKVSGAAGYQLWCSRVYEDFGAVGYDLYADGNEDWFWDGNRCTYMNNGSLEDGVTYSYKVRAVDANGNVGAFSKEVRITFEPVLATPVISVTTNAQYQPVLTWDKVSGAGYYEVWRWCEEDETDQRIRRTAGLTWTDATAELGKTYWYYLRAYSPDWNFTTDTGSYYSAWGYSMRWSVLDTPELTEAYSPEVGKAVIGWTKVSGADQYEIYRSTDGENYSLVNRTSALTWTDTTVQSGWISYKIRAVVNVGSAKGYSDFLRINFFVR